ncbi:type VI secretion system domain-containing protein [Cronobacter turicensis]|jgi:type VI secretion system protein VasJ|uniref:type VI secretion system domain-containing protein n=1 Tax=Cronobacter turicensis TaxID=413502 RepID=UPI000CFE0404|nr:type VI secretion system domain-containing protein [Cronobacter turicensis]EGT5680551.1 hypothetical protein [Cronobacter turicensis]EGT5738748.1 hypothetical protein [Cronobacter turicensis]ELQ6019700.1 type VI secretion system domain-containing protein [Cronobacter turicensis]ELQ6074520.1 type VI secretion system domain-containing protein [Cronobacter turicensis]ELQ6105524.1 type VI secretion system domain-containing protein [Cronobacter turicensis]
MISGQQTLTDIIAADHKELLTRLHGLETLIFNDGTPFAGEMTMKWLSQDVAWSASDWRPEVTTS